MAHLHFPAWNHPEAARDPEKAGINAAAPKVDHDAMAAYSAVERGLNHYGSMVDQVTGTKVFELDPEQAKELLTACRNRFYMNLDRHPGLNWTDFEARIKAHPDKLWTLARMIDPDIAALENGKYLVYEFTEECPRLGVVYDQQAEDELNSTLPDETCNGNALGQAEDIRAKLFSLADIKKLHALGQFDKKTMCWVETPPELREKGVALFAYCDEEGCYIQETKADSLYSGRGARFKLEV